MGKSENPSPQHLTKLLHQLEEGREAACTELFELVYGELKIIAESHFQRQPANHQLQPTSLVHELYLKLMGAKRLELNNRSHFYALASKVMRQLLVNHCKEHRAAKRGGDWRQVTWSAVQTQISNATTIDRLSLLDLDVALSKFALLDPRKSRVVELRFFAGLETSEVAQLLDVSVRTVESDWAFARAWLKKELNLSTPPAGS